jgi:rubrerythrin
MASQCPKCRLFVADDAVCCAGVGTTWKCQTCGKLSMGFVFPYGSCFLCGGPLRVVAAYQLTDPGRIEPIREAVQFEIDMYHFYRLAIERVSEPATRELLLDLRDREEEHLEELTAKYHVHLDPEILAPTARAEDLLDRKLFEGIDFEVASGIDELYRRAIELERRTQAHFERRAARMPSGVERELYRELAAEEVEHVAMLEDGMLAHQAGRS